MWTQPRTTARYEDNLSCRRKFWTGRVNGRIGGVVVHSCVVWECHQEHKLECPKDYVLNLYLYRAWLGTRYMNFRYEAASYI